MTNFRVIVSGNSGDGFRFRLEDVYGGPHEDVAPFVQHPEGLLVASSVAELQARLRALLRACEQPVLTLTRPMLRETLRGKEVP